MKKHLIAAAVAAAVAVPAMAQVTISGVLDVQAVNNFKRVSGTTTTKDTGSCGVATADCSNSLDGWSTSQLVFTASEDLGGGLKATAVWTQRMSNTTFGERDRSLELSGGFGAVRIGRFNPTITAGALGISGMATTGNAGNVYGFFLSGGLNDFSASGQDFASGNFERQDNLIQYSSPTINGLNGAIGYARSSDDISTTSGKDVAEQTYGTVNYSAGPLALAAGLGQRKNELEGVADKAKSSMYWLGGSYDLGVAKIHVLHGNRDQEIGTLEVHDAVINHIAVSVPYGATTFRAAFFNGNDDGQGTNSVKYDGYQISATYSLSKRTLLYFVTGENDKNRDGVSNATEVNTKQTGLGISHSF